jgi:hypothetical protein
MTTKPLEKGFVYKDGKIKQVATGSVSDKIRQRKSKKIKPGRKP